MAADSILTPDVDPAADATPADATSAEPDLGRTEQALASPSMRVAGITTLAVLALFYTLYFAREFLVPIAFAVLLNFLLSPVVRALSRLRIRAPLGAGMVMLALLGALGFGGYELTGPIESWAAKAPTTLATVQERLGKVRQPIERVSRTAEQVANAASVTAPTAAKPATVEVRGPSVVSRLFGTTQRLLAGLLEVLILLYFLLAAGDLFLQKLIKVLPNFEKKQTAVQIARETESSISTYLFTTAMMNIVEGAVVAGAMYLIGLPNPVLWGAMVAVLEFIPYVGAATMVLVLAVAGLSTFDGVGHAMLAPAVFLAINLIQANLVSPMLLGHRLALNPVALFIGLAFWFWIWGVAGAFIAVPMMATLKIFCDHIESLASVGEFLGKRADDERRAILR